MKILVGRVAKAQGINGELKVNCMLDDAKQLDKVTQLYIANTKHNVVKLRQSGSSFFVLFDDIKDRNTAEQFRDWELYADKECVNLPDDSYFVGDMIGCYVYTDNEGKLGEIVDILQYGSADVYMVKTELGMVSFPWLKKLIIDIDTDKKLVMLRGEELVKVMVKQYED